MTNDEILQAAKESELYLDGVNQSMPLYVMKTEDLQRFADIIEKRTIERCAVVAEELRHPDGFSGENVDWCAGTDHAAAAIRKLGEQ